MRKNIYSASRQENSVEKQWGKEPKKSKQMVAVDYVLDNYDGRLRFDDVAMKAQIFQLRDINDNKGYWPDTAIMIRRDRINAKFSNEEEMYIYRR